MSLNSSYTNFEPPKSDLLQKHLKQTGSAVQNVQIQTGNQNPYSNYPQQNNAPSIQTGPKQDGFETKKDGSKKAKIAAASLGTTLTIAAAAFLGKTKAGRKAAKHIGNLITSGCEKILQKLRSSVGNEKFDDTIKKFYDFRDNKLAKLNAVPENIVNGKDVFSRNAADIVTGRRLDTSKMTGLKKKAAEAYKKTVGKVLSWFHILDKHSTRLYENEGIKDGVKKYVKTSKNYEEYSASTLEELKKVLNANPDKKFAIGGSKKKASEILEDVEKLFAETGEKLTGLSSNANDRMWGYNNALKGLTKDANGELQKTAASLTEQATEGFMDKIKSKQFSELLTSPVAGSVVKDAKASYAKQVKDTVDFITKTTGTVVEDNIDNIAGLKKILGTTDIDTYTEIDKTLRLFDKYKKTLFDGSATSSKAQQELCGKLDDLIGRVTKLNTANGAEAVKTLESVKKSITSVQGGKVEEIMDIARQVLDNDTYNKVVLPQYRTFQKSLQNAYHGEVNDILDKLRDINCGCAPTDFMTVMGSVGLMGLYTAQAENNDERVSLTLSTGIPIVSTVATNLGCAIKSISGGKAMAVSLAVGGVTKFICDKINKAFRKSKGLDENSKPSVVTIDDYIPYRNKFGEIFMVPAGADVSKLN